MRLTVIVRVRARSNRLFALLEPFAENAEFVIENYVWEKALFLQAYPQKPVIAQNIRLAIPIKNT